MPTNHDAVAALANTGADRELLRAMLFARMPYVLADSDDPEDLVAVDPETGAVIWDILYLGRIFHFDPTDTTTAHDGVSTLVTQGGRRYKLDTLSMPRSVLDKDLTSPPGSPSIGDAYLINGAPSGGWAAFSVGDIVVLTARGWEAISAPDGSQIYVEDETGFYHRAAGGTWTAGFGSTPLSTNSVPMSAAINFGRRVIVEDQTTNAPPTSAQGTAYIIGSSPTGAWSGNAGKVAIRELSGSGDVYSIYTPAVGWTAYDKATGAELRFNGTAWVSQSGSWVGRSATFSSGNNSLSRTGSSAYNYSVSSPPTSSNYRTEDTATLSHTAKRAGARLRLIYRADFDAFASAGLADGARVTVSTKSSIAVFYDSVSNAVDWQAFPMEIVDNTGTLAGMLAGSAMSFIFEFDAPDALVHTYRVAFMYAFFNNGSADIGRVVTSVSRRLLTIEEGS
jgi:hypothetical protein